MSYTIRKVGEVTVEARSRFECALSEEAISFTDDVAGDEWLFLAVAMGAENFGGGAYTRLEHPMIDGFSIDGCGGDTVDHSGYCDPTFNIGNRHNVGISDPTGPNPFTGFTQPWPLLGPISSGDTANIVQSRDRGGTNTFGAYQAMLVAVKTVPALVGEVDGAVDCGLGGTPGVSPGPPFGPDQDVASATQTVTAFAGNNTHPGFGGASARHGEPYLLVAGFSAYTLSEPTYTDGWVEELSTDDGSGLRLGLVVKEIPSNDFNDYTVVGTWSGPENGSAELIQLGEDLPPGLHISHRLGFDN